MQAVCKTHCIKDNLNVGQEETWQVSKSKHRMILCLIAHDCNSFVASLLGRGNLTALLNWYYSPFSSVWLSLTLYLHSWLLGVHHLVLFCYQCRNRSCMLFSLLCNAKQATTCCLLPWSRLQLLLIPGFLISDFPVDEHSCKAQRSVLCLSCFDISPRDKSLTR